MIKMKLIKLNNDNFFSLWPSIEAFSSKRFPSGESFLKVEAKHYLDTYAKYRIFLIIDEAHGGEIVSYFVLEAASIFWAIDAQYPIPNPCVELSYFSLNDKFAMYNGHGLGLGQAIFKKYVMETIKYVAQNVGVEHIILFALPISKVINAYENMGFYLMNDDIAEYIRYYSVKDCKLMVYNLKKINS